MPLKVIQGLCPDKSGRDENEKAVAHREFFPTFSNPILNLNFYINVDPKSTYRVFKLDMREKNTFFSHQKCTFKS